MCFEASFEVGSVDQVIAAPEAAQTLRQAPIWQSLYMYQQSSFREGSDEYRSDSSGWSFDMVLELISAVQCDADLEE